MRECTEATTSPLGEANFGRCNPMSGGIVAKPQMSEAVHPATLQHLVASSQSTEEQRKVSRNNDFVVCD